MLLVSTKSVYGAAHPSAAALAAASTMALAAPSAADEVNVAFFLEWATPNLIAKTTGDYADSMGVDAIHVAMAGSGEATSAACFWAHAVDARRRSPCRRFLEKVGKGVRAEIIVREERASD